MGFVNKAQLRGRWSGPTLGLPPSAGGPEEAPRTAVGPRTAAAPRNVCSTFGRK